MICEAKLIDGLSDAQMRELFDAARDAAYEAITREAQALGRAADSAAAENRADLRGAKSPARNFNIAASGSGI